MDCHQEDIVRTLISSYREIGGINHVDCGNLPSKRAVASICADLLQLVFPGFFSDEAVGSDELEMLTNELVASIRQRLSVEVRRSLRLKNGVGDHAEEAGSEHQQSIRSERSQPKSRRERGAIAKSYHGESSRTLLNSKFRGAG